jgi:hypothetical protein
MYVVLLPRNATNMLASLARKFMWGRLDPDGTLHGWFGIHYAETKQKGIGVQDLQTINEALILKLVWHVAFGSDKLWVGLMRATTRVVHSCQAQ